MMLTVPFAYDVMGYEPRKRNVTLDRRRGETMVEIRDVEPGGMPLALVWNQAPDHRQREGRRVEIRAHADALWVRADASEDTPGDGHEGYSVGRLAGDSLAAAIRAGDRQGNPFAGFTADMPEAGKPDRLFTRVVRDGKENAEAEVASRAGELVAMGGELYLRCAEPVFRRDSSAGYDRASRGLVSCWNESWRHRTCATGGIYRADEWERLREDARRLHEGYEGMFDLPERQGHFEVLLPDALRLPSEGMALAAHAFDVVDRLGDIVSGAAKEFGSGRNSVRGRDSERDPIDWAAPLAVDMPEPVIVEAWMRLGAALSRGLDDAAIETFREVCALEPAVDPERSWRRDSLVEALAEARAALERWDARPFHMREAGHAAEDDDVAAFASLGPSP